MGGENNEKNNMNKTFKHLLFQVVFTRPSGVDKQFCFFSVYFFHFFILFNI